MKRRLADDRFTARNRALLAAWDRHNARVAGHGEHDAAFEDRLIAAGRAARAAALHGAGTDDEICRQLAADARAAGRSPALARTAMNGTGPTYDRSLDAGFTEEKTLQQSDVRSR